MLLHPGPYEEVPKQPCNPMLANLNPVNSEAIMDQLAQPKAPEAWVYGIKFEVCPYGLFTSGQMIAKVQVSCAYNYLPCGILQLTINELANKWDVPLLLQEKLEEPEQIYIFSNFVVSAGKTLLVASDYMISSRILGGWF